MKFPVEKAKIFKVTYYTLALNIALTLTSNFISVEFYFKYIVFLVLIIVGINVLMTYIVYGKWVYQQKLLKQNLFRILTRVLYYLR
jgi:hypothetical protein